MNKEQAWNYSKIALIIIIVVAIGLFAMNQMFSMVYKMQLLKDPCNLCVELNPEWEQCYKLITTPVAGNASNTINMNLSFLENIKFAN